VLHPLAALYPTPKTVAPPTVRTAKVEIAHVSVCLSREGRDEKVHDCVASFCRLRQQSVDPHCIVTYTPESRTPRRRVIFGRRQSRTSYITAYTTFVAGTLTVVVFTVQCDVEMPLSFNSADVYTKLVNVY